MSRKSNDQGRAYEFAYLITLYREITKFRETSIIKNSSYFAAEKAWNTLSDTDKTLYKLSALAGINSLFCLEPLILDDEIKDCVELILQPDNKGKIGDVRDVLIIRKGIEWEIGLSVKHNHFAVKHSRLSPKIDFGEKWYGIKCSEQYWNEIKPIFDYLTAEQKKDTKWRELINKEDEIYYPLLNAFKTEIYKQYDVYKTLPTLIVEYLLGKFDFHKLISIDHRRITQVQSYNLRGTLNKQGNIRKRKIDLPIIQLPTRIISLDYKLNSKNTLELYLDNGWQFSFRIHNASTIVEPSLKFDIQLIGVPEGLLSVIDSHWE